MLSCNQILPSLLAVTRFKKKQKPIPHAIYINNLVNSEGGNQQTIETSWTYLERNAEKRSSLCSK